eukprot:CAMPEP_0197658060 /NCGR_PEP_ID=MMETSP1338-20131121/45004_1 /TAXON_ID=43686 ORGANISM="Pelagodinium beii, Strain RCC1491" /NCGR_SAMPLE_ID=MMETSP1338 /ASSEMBLY_ACC=CAM_ASM_000754 /LENGTH=956 /DNA_ID=CAMNT_0043234561 /DNA_START=36 /DNA_END=2907 /DNA_ORIENTATION=-
MAAAAGMKGVKGNGKGFGKSQKGVQGQPELVVSGCKHDTVGQIVRGGFVRSGENHGRPTYRKTQKADGKDVNIYFWDSRDGANMSGWWFGSMVGGDVVWAFNPNTGSQTPPPTGWKVPYEGQVDPTMGIKTITAKPAQSPPQQSGEVGEVAHIFVTGCTHGTVGPIVKGAYSKNGESHGKPIFKKSEKANGNDVLLYYWHDETSLSFCGWWFGPVVGGEEVWAFHPSRTNKSPPTSGWKVPYDGPVDSTFIISADKKRLMEEKKQKQDAENKKRAEEKKAVGQIKTVLNKMKAVKAEDFSSLEEELKKVMEKELEACGAEKAKVKEECDKSIKEAQERLEKKKETQAKAEPILKELDGLVEAAEAAVKKLSSKASDADVKAVDSKLQACQDLIKAHGTTLNSVEGVLPKLFIRTSECKKLLKKAGSTSKLAETMAKIAKYDANKDGLLEKAELAKYAQGEFKFALAKETADAIFKKLAGGAKGIKKDNFHKLKVQVGIAREKAIDLEKKKRREKREAELAELKVQLKAKLEEIAKTVPEAEEAVNQLKETTNALKTEAGKPKNSEEMVKKLDEIDEKSKAAKELIAKTKKSVTDVKEGADKDILAWLGREQQPIYSKLKQVEKMAAQNGNHTRKMRLNADQKLKKELVKVQRHALEVLKQYQKDKDLSSEALFEQMSSKGEEPAVEEANFVSFLEKCFKEASEKKAEGAEKKAENGETPSSEALRRVFAVWDESNAGVLNKERMTEILRNFKKVARKTVITDGVSIKDSKVVRQLEPGEVLELLGNPVSESEVDVMRVKSRAMNDGVEGFVTISGNQGTQYLEDGGGIFKVVKETLLTESFEIEAESKEKSQKIKDSERKLKPGEQVEVRTWMKKDEESGLIRMKCKAISDGTIGWATVKGNQGTVFLELKEEFSFSWNGGRLKALAFLLNAQNQPRRADIVTTGVACLPVCADDM